MSRGRPLRARCLGMLIDGRAQATGIKRPAMDATMLLILNAHHEAVEFRLPEIAGGERLRCLLDTAQPDGSDTPVVQTRDACEVAARSLLLFELERSNAADARGLHRPALDRAIRRLGRSDAEAANLLVRALVSDPAPEDEGS